MKYRVILLTAFLFSCIFAGAQSVMTDDQVLKYVVTETQKGTSQQQMAADLIKKGVTTSQLQRVRQKAEKLRKEAESGSKQKAKKGSASSESDILVDAAQSRAEELGLNPDEEVVDGGSQEFLGMTEDEQRQVFGRNIFNSKKLTFQAPANLTTPANYVLGAGDQVMINVWGTSQQTIEASITSDGYVVVDGIGPIKLAGLTVERAKQVLKSKLSAYYSGCSVDLSLMEARNVQVQVMGEVEVPGSYTLSALSSAFNALYMAGGISKIGSLRDIQIFRGGKLSSTLDVYDYILNGNGVENIGLQDNDIIIVGAYNNLVQIKGSVKRPMWYEMKKDETVADLLRYAGNFSGNAFTKSVRITRKAGSEYSVHTVTEERMPIFQLADEDQVQVDSIRARFMNRVEVRGAVKYPGQFELGEDIKTVRQLLLAAEGFSEDAYEGVAIMHRENKDLTIRMMNVDVHGILNGTSADVELKNNDVLFVPSKSEMLGERVIDVKGEVVYPGTYPFADNTTIQDIILQSGGITEAGSLARVDVFRRIRDNDSEQGGESRSESFTFSLDERYAVRQDTTFYLQPHDIVVVRKSPAYEEQRSVFVQGEVNFGGQYTITSKNYRLSDLVKDCGGFTKLAYVNGARLTRIMTKEEMEQRDQANLKAQIQLYEDGLKEGKDLNMQIADSLLSLKMKASNTFPVAINLQRALEEPGSTHDLLLREGDILEVPECSNIIKVSGEVMYPVSMSYEEGKSLSYYIKHAGGYSGNAAKKRVYGIQANGSVVKLKGSSKKDIQPGIEIVVPSKQTRRKMSTTEVIGIGSGVAALAGVIVSLLNATK